MIRHMGDQSSINRWINHVYVTEPSKISGHGGLGSIPGGQCSVHVATHPDSRGRAKELQVWHVSWPLLHALCLADLNPPSVSSVINHKRHSSQGVLRTLPANDEIRGWLGKPLNLRVAVDTEPSCVHHCPCCVAPPPPTLSRHFHPEMGAWPLSARS